MPLSRAPQDRNAGIRPEIISALPALKPPARKTTTEQYVTGWKSTSVIDTPMRKLEVLESLTDGLVMLRDTDYNKARADLSFIALAYHEAQALSTVLAGLQAADDKTRERVPTNGNGKRP